MRWALWVAVALLGCDGPTGEAADAADADRLDLSQPDVGQPDAGMPDAGQPDAGQPDAGQPDAGQPDAGQPDAGQPDVGQPDVGQPDTGQPDAAAPDAGQPDAAAPDAAAPNCDQPDAPSCEGGGCAWIEGAGCFAPDAAGLCTTLELGTCAVRGDCVWRGDRCLPVEDAPCQALDGRCDLRPDCEASPEGCVPSQPCAELPWLACFASVDCRWITEAPAVSACPRGAPNCVRFKSPEPFPEAGRCLDVRLDSPCIGRGAMACPAALGCALRGGECLDLTVACAQAGELNCALQPGCDFIRYRDCRPIEPCVGDCGIDCEEFFLCEPAR